MTRQSLVSIGVLTAAAAVVVCSAGSVAAQGDYVVPRTEYGHPDLQGFWTNQTYTPLERPRDVDKAFYTEEEAAAIWQGRAGRESSLTTPGTIPDVHYDFTQFGLDRSQSTMASNLRTSLIVDPPTGRLPERTAEGVRRADERRAAREARGGQYDRAENLPLGARCIITGSAGPPMLNAGYNANFHIVQGRDHVMILIEQLHNARIIPIDDRPQPPEATRSGWGCRGAGGRATRSSSRPPTSTARTRSGGPATGCGWSSGSRAWPTTTSCTRSRWRTRRPGLVPGRPRCP